MEAPCFTAAPEKSRAQVPSWLLSPIVTSCRTAALSSHGQRTPPRHLYSLQFGLGIPEQALIVPEVKNVFPLIDRQSAFNYSAAFLYVT